MRLQPAAALGALVLVAAGLGACAAIGAIDGANDTAGLRRQQPPLPSDQAAAWGPQDRLYRSVAVDYVGGVSQPSQFRRLLEDNLDRAGLLAPTPTSARYALQVAFSAGGSRNDSRASYRIISRENNRIVFEQDVTSTFAASYAPLAGKDGEVLGARRGVLAPEGYVSRYGQADVQRMTQSIVRFVIKLGASEEVKFAAVVPCLDNAEVTALKGALTANGVPWRTDDCRAYRQPKADGGVRFTSFQ